MIREFSREEYSIRITWLIWGRAVLASLLTGTLLFFQHRYRIYTFHPVVLYYVLFAVYVLTAIYHYLVRRYQDLFFLAYLQTSVDILLITYFVYLTGGIDSGLSILYHLTIISASIILYRRGGYLAASLSSILYGAMLDMQYYNVLGLVRSQNYETGQVFYQVFINFLSFYGVALLSGYLSERLRSTRQELREKSIDFEDLRVMQEHILRSVGSGILTLDLEGNVTSWNPAAEQITGYRTEDIKGNWQELFGTSLKSFFGNTETLRDHPHRFNGQIVKKDGTTAILGMIASLLKDDANAVRGIILTFQDITKMVEMEERVRRQERLATVGSLAAGIAHEIRNPLASLSGSIQLLQNDLKPGGDDKRLMDIVVRETDRLNTIITDFLEYARPKTTQSEQIELRPLLEETIMLLKNSKVFSGNIRIASDIDPRIKLQGDAQRLRQVFWNLLINACQAMPEGGDISVVAKPYFRGNGSNGCEIVFSDTGESVESELLGKIFDPFFTTKTGGTGLGLAIAYRIIEDHQGTIAVEKGPDRGTRFILRLPLSMEASAATPPDDSGGEHPQKGAQRHE